MKVKYFSLILIIGIVLVSACKKEETKWTGENPDNAPEMSVDRFSDLAGNLMKRSEDASLPGPNTPINFDEEPFITQSLGPDGQMVKYYNFDMQPLPPIPVYMLVSENGEAIENQLTIFDVIPGELTYNDFWQVYNVQVSNDYVANAITSYQDILNSNFTISKTTDIINCPIIPKGSTATLRLTDETNEIQQAWCRDSIVYYFTFMEKVLTANNVGLTPISNIYVCFNKNPDPNDPTSGPPSGFVKETGSDQTHNVIATLPADSDYSSLWSVQIFDNAEFENVSDLESVQKASLVMEDAGFVNCPLVYVGE